MPTVGEITVKSVGAVPWEDVATVFGTRGDPAGCWCQFFKLPNEAWDDTRNDEFKRMLQEQVNANDPAPGVIAYLEGEPVGWCAVEPRANHAQLQRSKMVLEGSTENPDDASVWAVTCFVVRVGFRRRGIGSALLRGAVEQAPALGARVLEGYPVDTAVRTKASSADLYHGTVSQFVAAGFEIVARPVPGRAVVRLVV